MFTGDTLFKVHNITFLPAGVVRTVNDVQHYKQSGNEEPQTAV